VALTDSWKLIRTRRSKVESHLITNAFPHGFLHDVDFELQASDALYTLIMQANSVSSFRWEASAAIVAFLRLRC
jgi:hypothetical protein